MPHLSPMAWIVALFSFYLILGMFMSTLWWQQMPSFPPLTVKMPSKNNKWNWL
nr:ATP synthase F0 subunit 8 [Micropodarke fujianensis]